MHYNGMFLAVAGCIVLLGNTLIDAQSGEILFDCPEGNGLYPNRVDCHSYYICDNGEVKVEFCGKELHFNNHSKTCDFSVHADCVDQHKTRRVGALLERKAEIVEVLGICETLTCPCVYAIENDCSSYYRCHLGIAYLERCSQGLVFDAEKLSCNYRAEVTCTTISTTADPETPATNSNYELPTQRGSDTSPVSTEFYASPATNATPQATSNAPSATKATSVPTKSTSVGNKTIYSPPPITTTTDYEPPTTAESETPNYVPPTMTTVTSSSLVHITTNTSTVPPTTTFAPATNETVMPLTITYVPATNTSGPPTSTYYPATNETVMPLTVTYVSATNTSGPPTVTYVSATNTSGPPTSTYYPATNATSVTPTSTNTTSVPLTTTYVAATNTSVPPTTTYAPATNATSVPPTTKYAPATNETVMPPTTPYYSATNATSVSPTATNATSVSPTATNATSVSPTATNTSGPPTSTYAPATNETVMPTTTTYSSETNTTGPPTTTYSPATNATSEPPTTTYAPATNETVMPTTTTNETSVTPTAIYSPATNTTSVPPTTTYSPATNDTSVLPTTTYVPVTNITSVPPTTTNPNTTPTTYSKNDSTSRTTDYTSSKTNNEVSYVSPSSSTQQVPIACSCANCKQPDLTNCSSYFQCSGGYLKKLECPVSLFYNAEIQACDSQDNVQCQANPDSCVIADGYYPDVRDCGSYVICHEGKPFSRKCSTGLQYNARKRVCDLPENVRCGDINFDLMAKFKESLSCPCPSCLLPDADDCSMYYLCSNGTAYVGNCAEGLLFDGRTRTCNYATMASCSKKSSECSSPDEIYKHHDNCSMYTQCVGGIAYQRECPSGMHFNSETNMCTMPCIAQCDQDMNCPAAETTPIVSETSEVQINPETTSPSDSENILYPDYESTIDGLDDEMVSPSVEATSEELSSYDGNNSEEILPSPSITSSEISTSIPYQTTPEDGRISENENYVSESIDETSGSLEDENSKSTEDSSSNGPDFVEDTFSPVVENSKYDELTTVSSEAYPGISATGSSALEVEVIPVSTAEDIGSNDSETILGSQIDEEVSPSSLVSIQTVPIIDEDRSSVQIIDEDRSSVDGGYDSTLTTEKISSRPVDFPSSSIIPDYEELLESTVDLDPSTAEIQVYTTEENNDIEEGYSEVNTALIFEKSSSSSESVIGTRDSTVEISPNVEFNISFSGDGEESSYPTSEISEMTTEKETQKYVEPQRTITEYGSNVTTYSTNTIVEITASTNATSVLQTQNIILSSENIAPTERQNVTFNPFNVTVSTSSMPETQSSTRDEEDSGISSSSTIDSVSTSNENSTVVEQISSSTGMSVSTDENSSEQKDSTINGMSTSSQYTTRSSTNGSNDTQSSSYEVRTESEYTPSTLSIMSSSQYPVPTENYHNISSYTDPENSSSHEYNTENPIPSTWSASAYTDGVHQPAYTFSTPSKNYSEAPSTLYTNPLVKHETSSTYAGTTPQYLTESSTVPYATQTNGESLTTYYNQIVQTYPSRNNQIYSTLHTESPPYQGNRSSAPIENIGAENTTMDLSEVSQYTSMMYQTSSSIGTVGYSRTEPNNVKNTDLYTSGRTNDYITPSYTNEGNEESSFDSYRSSEYPNTTIYINKVTNAYNESVNMSSNFGFSEASSMDPISSMPNSTPSSVEQYPSSSTNEDSVYTQSSSSLPSEESSTDFSTVGTASAIPQSTTVSASDYYTPEQNRPKYSTEILPVVVTEIPPSVEVTPSLCDEENRIFYNRENCTFYFSCESQKFTILQCPEGLHFSKATKKCDTPCNARCDASIDCSTFRPTTSQELSLPLCNGDGIWSVSGQCRSFQICSKRKQRIQSCPSGLHFNSSTRTCDWPSNARCGDDPRPLKLPDYHHRCQCDFCFEPDRTNCTKFHLCLKWRSYSMECSPGLLFDVNLSTCTYDHYAQCGTSNSLIMKLSTGIPMKDIYICPEQSGLFSYPGECTRFIQCSNWYPYVMQCPATLHFSPGTRRCDYPCNALCESNIVCSTTAIASPAYTHQDKLCSCYNCLLPVSDTCVRYLSCESGKARQRKCPRGQLFDTNKMKCDWAHKVDCPHIFRCPERNGLFADSKDCHKFFHCSNGVPYFKDCPAGLEFDPVQSLCTYPNSKFSSTQVALEPVYTSKYEDTKFKCPKRNGYFADRENCASYYHCKNYFYELNFCPEPLLFNYQSRTCDWPNNVRCSHQDDGRIQRCSNGYLRNFRCPKDSVFLITFENCDGYLDCSSGRACKRKCAEGLQFDKSNMNCNVAEVVQCVLPPTMAPAIACRNARGLLPDPTNHKCYYRCINGRPVQGCCSRNKVFNVDHKRCRWTEL